MKFQQDRHFPIFCFGKGWNAMRCLIAATLICVAVMTTSCRSSKAITKEIPVYVHDTTKVTKEIHDSTYIDRWHTEYMRGDTIFVTNNQITVKYRTRTDTVYKVIEKPVETIVSQIKEVEKPLKGWQKTLIWLGVGFLIVLVGTVVSFCVFFKNAK